MSAAWVSGLQTILLIDDDARLGRSLTRFVEASFPGFQVLWVRNAIAGLAAVREHADTLRLVVLDVTMPLMDGNTAAVRIRDLAPSVPILPFTAHTESLAALVALGCAAPALKSPETLSQLPERMRAAMALPVAPLPDLPWVAALRQSGQALLAFVDGDALGDMLISDGATAGRVQRALTHLDRYCRRVHTPAAREIQQARAVLREVIEAPQ